MSKGEHPDYPSNPCGQEYHPPPERILIRIWRGIRRWLKGLGPLECITIVLVIATSIQSWAFIQSERAFIFPTDTNFAQKLVPGIPYIPMYVVVKNSGKSTAIIDEFSAAITHDLPTVPTYGRTATYAWPPVVAGGTAQQIMHFETDWNQERIDEMISGSRSLYLFGRIKFSDDYTIIGPRTAGFCFTLVPKTDPPIFQTCKEREYTYIK